MENKDINRKFCLYDVENPHIWKEFQNLSFQLIERGFNKLSAELIYNQIRWLKYMQHGNDGFKINNNFKAFYARKFMKEFPVYNGIFELRKSKFDEDN
jgi:hypothetical protein